MQPGLAVIYVVLGAAYYAQSRGIHMVVLIVAAIGCYAMSLAPVTWVVIAEIFPNRIRGAAMSVAVLALWMACTVLTFTFPYLNLYLGAHGTFWLYAAICVADSSSSGGGCRRQRTKRSNKSRLSWQLERLFTVWRGSAT